MTTTLTVVIVVELALTTGWSQPGPFSPLLFQPRRSLVFAVLVPAATWSHAAPKPLAATVLLCDLVTPLVEEVGGQRLYPVHAEPANPGVVVAEMGAHATRTTGGTTIATTGGVTTARTVTPTVTLNITTGIVTAAMVSLARGGVDQIPLPVIAGALSAQPRMHMESTQG